MADEHELIKLSWCGRICHDQLMPGKRQVGRAAADAQDAGTDEDSSSEAEGVRAIPPGDQTPLARSRRKSLPGLQQTAPGG